MALTHSLILIILTFSCGGSLPSGHHLTQPSGLTFTKSKSEREDLEYACTGSRGALWSDVIHRTDMRVRTDQEKYETKHKHPRSTKEPNSIEDPRPQEGLGDNRQIKKPTPISAVFPLPSCKFWWMFFAFLISSLNMADYFLFIPLFIINILILISFSASQVEFDF